MMQIDEFWQALLERNQSYNDRFVYGVISTKIYCLPSCPSRKPKRKNVLFFNNYVEAETKGFRACKRCYPNLISLSEPNLELIAQICQLIKQKTNNQLTLTQLGIQFHLSPYHLQRIFKRIVGITPKQYAEACRVDRFKSELSQGKTITDALYQVGYNSSSSLYEKTSAQLGMTPKIYQQGAKETKIVYTIVSCSLGYLLVATTERGICAVKLGNNSEELAKILVTEFKQAEIIRDDENHRNWIVMILNFLAGKEPNLDLPLNIRGTAFQKQVWQALQQIPYGKTCTYQDLACSLGKPKAVRAVANACGANPTALIIPCHRVIRKDGNLGGYRWGIECKQELLAQEAAVASIDRQT